MADEVGKLTKDRWGTGPKSWAEDLWHSEKTQIYPPNHAAFKDVKTLFKRFVIKGHAPKKPLLGDKDNVVTIGSCFAAELRHFLNCYGFSSDSFWVPSGLNNTYAIRDFISWAVTGEWTAKGYAYGDADEGGIEEWAPEKEQQTYREQFENAGAIVFTLGLGEVWEDSETGAVFWRGVPERIFEKGRHVFRLTTVEENVQNIRAIISLLREANPTCPIIMTLSPVPMKATFGDVSCMTADCVSKSVLRVALHEALQGAGERVFYWPSFEMVKWAGGHFDWPVYGLDDPTVRHVTRYLVINILALFLESFYGKDAAARFEKAFKEEHGDNLPEDGPCRIEGCFVEA